MNAVPQIDTFIPATATEWMVLRCSPARTIPLANALAWLGAWTPTWTRRRRLPRSPVTRPMTEACIPTFVFLPVSQMPGLPRSGEIIGQRNDRRMVPAYHVMFFDGALVRIADHELNHLRKVADKPVVPVTQLPRAGRSYRIQGLGFDGLKGTVLSCTPTKCFVEVKGFAHPLQIPPSLLEQSEA